MKICTWYFVRSLLIIVTMKVTRCRVCSKSFDSSQYFVHLREQHTHKKTIIANCHGCLQEFHSPIINPRGTRTQTHYKNCENCRDKAKEIGCKPLVHGEYVYGEHMERFKIDKGSLIRICPIIPCTAEFENCANHPDLTAIRQCAVTKCKNCFLEPPNTHSGAVWLENRMRTQCNACVQKNGYSKDKRRVEVKDLKIQLGGSCVKCGDTDLFSLEFNHKDVTQKIKQITRSAPSDWLKELHNLELLCSRCHRMHTAETLWINKEETEIRENWFLVRALKLGIGRCQTCDWTLSENKDLMTYALDFDHVSVEDKYKRISRMYKGSREELLFELTKVRLICRSCHEKVTCFQRGGKKFKEYYTENEIATLKSILLSDEKISQDQQELQDALKQYSNCILHSIQ